MAFELQINRIADALPWFAARHLKRAVPERWGYFHVFNEKPLVVLIPEDTYDDATHWQPFFEALRKTRVHFLCMLRGAVEADPAAYGRQMSELVQRHRERFPGHAFTYLANNETQVALYTQAGLASLFVNHNAYVNENVFRILPGEEKRFDAIYNAFCAPFKRHHLAQKVRSLALVTYLRGAESSRYFAEHLPLLAHAHWLNFPSVPPREADYRPLAPPELCQWLNRARCGLCLSAREGAMYASVEYLLSGLPVVTTASLGGRDVFFEPDFALTVDDDPDAVARGVEEMLRRPADPQSIRARTLARIGEHRRRLVDFIVATAAAEGVRLDAARIHERIFANPAIMRLQPFHHILRLR